MAIHMHYFVVKYLREGIELVAADDKLESGMKRHHLELPTEDNPEFDEIREIGGRMYYTALYLSYWGFVYCLYTF